MGGITTTECRPQRDGTTVATGQYSPLDIGFDRVEERTFIVTSLLRRGRGVEGSAIRCVTQIWLYDGTLVAEWDPMPEDER